MLILCFFFLNHISNDNCFFSFCYIQYTIITLLTLLTLLTILLTTTYNIFNPYVTSNITYSTIVTYITITNTLNIQILCLDNFFSFPFSNIFFQYLQKFNKNCFPSFPETCNRPIFACYIFLGVKFHFYSF